MALKTDSDAYKKALAAPVVKERRGMLKVATIDGAPIYVHWSFGAGGLFLAAINGFGFPESLYYCLAFGALILLHEAGHFVAARCLGLRVISVDLSGMSGKCEVEAPRRVRDVLLVFSAGLVVQAVLLAVALYYFGFDAPSSVFGKCVMNTFLYVNIYIIIANILPYTLPDGTATDGQVLLNLYRHAVHGAPHPFPNPFATTCFHPREASLLEVKALVPAGFTTGIEIFNDATTPMEFVVTILERHLGIDHASAVPVMLGIHQNGGALLPVASMGEAERIAAAISADAIAQGHQLLCRAVDAGAGGQNQ